MNRYPAPSALPRQRPEPTGIMSLTAVPVRMPGSGAARHKAPAQPYPTPLPYGLLAARHSSLPDHVVSFLQRRGAHSPLPFREGGEGVRSGGPGGGAPTPNFAKHTSRNPLQRWLIRRFHERVAGLVVEVLGSAELADRPILDLGCGEGFALGAIGRRVPGLAWHGCDLDPAALVRARRKHPAAYCAAEATRLPYPEGSFGLVLALELIEHLPAPADALDEIARVGDRAVLSVPHQPFFALANALRGKNWPTGGDDPDHRHWWTAAGFAALVRSRLTLDRLVFSFPWVIAVARRVTGGG